jgi:hypothetical protein
LTQKNSISQVFPSKEDLVHKWYGNGIFFQDSGFGQFSQESWYKFQTLAILTPPRSTGPVAAITLSASPRTAPAAAAAGDRAR